MVQKKEYIRFSGILIFLSIPLFVWLVAGSNIFHIPLGAFILNIAVPLVVSISSLWLSKGIENRILYMIIRMISFLYISLVIVILIITNY